MAHITLNSYLQQIQKAWHEGDGDTLAYLLSFRHGHVASSKLQVESSMAEEAVARVLEAPVNEIVAAHLRVVCEVSQGRWAKAFEWQSTVVATVGKWLQVQKDENWALSTLLAVCVDLRLLAMQAEKQQDKQGAAAGAPRKADYLEKAAESLMGCFRVCASDNRSTDEDTKRWGMLALVNQLFKVYFGINKLHLCRPLIRAIESSPLKDNFSLSQQVTYRYYVGRKAMFDSDYRMAEEYLSFAFERCHKSSQKNKRLILVYLVPVKMLLGYMPKHSVLEKYDLLPFWAVAEAVKHGNVAQLSEAMQLHEAFFIKCGIYIILEKLKMIAYRNLFKKVYQLLQTHLLPVSALLAALQCGGLTDADEDETQCIVANLIFDGKIKGYISHQHQKLVVSKQNAFPPLSTVGPT